MTASSISPCADFPWAEISCSRRRASGGASAYILCAKNDPFIRILPETRGKIVANPNITFIETKDGGHCSFVGERDGYDGYFAERAVVEFFDTVQNSL